MLKPSLHIVRDYFKDFALRRGTPNFPTKRVFIDKNGFRHFWSGIEDRISNLRKSDSFKNARTANIIDLTRASNDYSTVKKKKPLRKKKFTDGIESNYFKVDQEALRSNSTTQKNSKPNNTSTIVQDTNSNVKRTLVKTTFFCPFFGVVTMTNLLKE